MFFVCALRWGCESQAHNVTQDPAAPHCSCCRRGSISPEGFALKLCCYFLLVLFFFHVQRLNENLRKLTAKFEKATSDKLKCQQEAEATACTIALANRLVSVSKCSSGGMNGRYQVLLRCEPHAHSTLHPLFFLEYVSCTAASFSNENDFALAVFIHQGRHCSYCYTLFTGLISFLLLKSLIKY